LHVGFTINVSPIWYKKIQSLSLPFACALITWFKAALAIVHFFFKSKYIFFFKNPWKKNHL